MIQLKTHKTTSKWTLSRYFDKQLLQRSRMNMNAFQPTQTRRNKSVMDGIKAASEPACQLKLNQLHPILRVMFKALEIPSKWTWVGIVLSNEMGTVCRISTSTFILTPSAKFQVFAVTASCSKKYDMLEFLLCSHWYIWEYDNDIMISLAWSWLCKMP